MRADKLTLEKIFDRTERLEVPLFQRPYVWNKDRNWMPLWEAIEAILEKRVTGKPYRPHFLGTVVLDQIKTPTGEIHARQLIDGQQRLTTLQLALAVARDLSKELGEERYAEAFRKLTDNYVPLSENEDEVFKVWPTNADRTDFRDVMRANSMKAVESLPHADPDDEFRIPNAYQFFAEVFSNWIRSDGDANIARRIKLLHDSLREDMLIVVIDLEENDDAQEIFETLNALGTPLLPADLVKNHLFHLAEAQQTDTQKLYDKHWKEFDEEKSYWREEVRQGRLKRPRLDLFLGHYLTLKTGQDIIINQLFSAFRDYVQETNGQNAEVHMIQFKSYADVYRSFDGFSPSSRSGSFFHRLHLMDTTTVYPLLLEVFKVFRDHGKSDLLSVILVDLESFLVRRSVCELTPKNYNKFFSDMVRHLLEGGEFTPAQVRTHLLMQTSEVSRWPDDKEFKEAWTALPFYRRLKRTKSRMILEALESALHSEKTEKIRVDEDLTIEHLLPQKWEKHWPLSLRDGTVEEIEAAKRRRSELLHRIGNLTLLTKKLNPSVSNGPWERKRDEILKHSALNLNRGLRTIDRWDEREIEKRTTDLFEVAMKVWPHPGGKE